MPLLLLAPPQWWLGLRLADQLDLEERARARVSRIEELLRARLATALNAQLALEDFFIDWAGAAARRG